MRRTVALTLAGLFCVFGYWLGEGVLPLWGELAVASGLLGGLVVAVVLPGKPGFKAIAGMALLGLYTLAIYLGTLSYNRAYNECLERGEEVRHQLGEYYEMHKQYPEHLSQLENFGLCKRLIRPTILKYKRTREGYMLSFGDWLVEHTATESEAFMAHK